MRIMIIECPNERCQIYLNLCHNKCYLEEVPTLSIIMLDFQACDNCENTRVSCAYGQFHEKQDIDMKN